MKTRSVILLILIIIAAIIFIILAVVAFFYYQRPQPIAVVKTLSIPNIAAPAKNEKFSLATEMKKNLLASTFSFSGKIIKISNNIITLEAIIPDLSKINDKTKLEKGAFLPTIKKNYDVIVVGDTKLNGQGFNDLKLANFKTDDWITITATEVIFDKSELTAKTIFKHPLDPNSLPPVN